MPRRRYSSLIACVAAILFAAVLGQAVAQQAEFLFDSCATEHQDGGPDDGSHCPCVCHHQQAATVEWQGSMPSPIGTVSAVVEQSLASKEAPPASIEYPPQLA